MEEGNLSPRGLEGTSSGSLLRRLSSFLPPWVPEGLKRSRRERAAEELNNRRRPRRGGECTQAKWPHSRTSGPPSRPSVYLFTFPGSSNTSAFSKFGSMGAALVSLRPSFSFSPHRRFTPVGGGVRSKRQQTGQERKILLESEERPGHTPCTGAWLEARVDEVGVLGWHSAPPPHLSISFLGLRASWEALCSHPSPFGLVKSCSLGVSSRGV